jgi:uncharacterized protein (DUF983 family)
MGDAKGSALPPMRTMLGRGLRLRCPRCGGARLTEGWLKLKPRCPACGLRTERGEEDYFLGGMMFNIALAEGVFGILFVGLVVAMWPDVPWRVLHVGGILLMIAMPFLFYPLSNTLWLAVELFFRPLTDEEMEWHRTAAEDAFRPQSRR